METEKITSESLDWPHDIPMPNLFIAGFPRSGTTAMGNFLAEHPDVFMPRKRGMHYFGSDLPFPDFPERFDVNLYAEHFRQAAGAKIVCETSVWYAYSARAPAEFKKLNPHAKVIIMIREPVETIYSLHSRLYWMGNEDIFDFRKALQAEEPRKSSLNVPAPPPLTSPVFYRDAIKYADYLKPYFDVMGRENVHVIIYDDFVEDPAGEYGKTMEFLGLEPDFSPPSFQVMNPHTTVRSSYVHQLLKRPPRAVTVISRSRFLSPAFERLKIKKVIAKLNKKQGGRPPLDPGLEKELREEFRPEVEKLGNLLARDLSHWSESKGS